jgi:hypothetical protein
MLEIRWLLNIFKNNFFFLGKTTNKKSKLDKLERGGERKREGEKEKDREREGERERERKWWGRKYNKETQQTINIVGVREIEQDG